MRRHALTLRPRDLFALLGGGAIAETDGNESLEAFYSATHLHCWRGTVWHCCLGTCWHCCLGTCSHCCLGTCWHCCRGSSEHCCRGTVWHCCLDTGSQTWFKDIFHPGFQFFNLTSRWRTALPWNRLTLLVRHLEVKTKSKSLQERFLNSPTCLQTFLWIG